MDHNWQCKQMEFPAQRHLVFWRLKKHYLYLIIFYGVFTCSCAPMDEPPLPAEKMTIAKINYLSLSSRTVIRNLKISWPMFLNLCIKYPKKKHGNNISALLSVDATIATSSWSCCAYVIMHTWSMALPSSSMAGAGYQRANESADIQNTEA